MFPRRPGKPHFKKARKSHLGLWATIAVGVILAVYVGVIFNSRPTGNGDRLRVDTFVDLAGQGRIKDAHILDQDSHVVGRYLHDDSTPAGYDVAYLSESRERLVEVLLDNRIPFDVKQQFSKKLLGPATILLPALIVVVVFIYLILSYQRGSGLFGLKSGARKIGSDHDTATFDDIAGQAAAVTELREVKDFLSDPDRFTSLGALVPKGILLFGPPGCGKTLLARAVAGEAGAAFYSISGSDFVELYVGVGAARVRDLFAEARDNAPAIVFIDELDSVGRRRKGNSPSGGGSGEEQEQALNQILAELDGFSPLQGIIVIGATNRPDILDPALLRPGRFDRTIGLERPDEAGRLAILEVHAKNKPLSPEVSLAEIARRAVGLSGADLASVMNEGSLLAARAGEQTVSQETLETALTRILEAPERQRRLSMRDRSFGRATGSQQRVTFADVAGLGEAIEELTEVKEYLAEPERFVAMGARPPRGFMLTGPPGCGKTLRDLFAEARTAAPSIVFIDEIDAIGARRGVGLDGGREREQTLNQILVELDGFDARAGVIVMAASNRPDILDEALVRPGRFDRIVAIALPDRAARRSILALHAQGKPLGGDIDVEVLAGTTQGFSGADLANVMNEAALLATRRHHGVIDMALIEEAVGRVGMGIAGARELSGEDRRMVAYHEIGHALVGRALAGARTPHKVSIVARGDALGATFHLEGIDRLIFGRSVLIEQMAGLLGGRAAEELVFGEPGSGAADDLARVTDVARRMVCELGMSEALGPLAYNDGFGLDGRGRGYSEEAARTIDAEIRRLVDEAHRLARSVLASSRSALDDAASALLQRETLTAAELDELAGPVPVQATHA